MFHPLLASDVAALLGVTAARVRQLDDELRPARTPGGVRVYERAAVDRAAGALDVRRAARRAR